MKAKIELSNITAVKKFTNIVSTIDCDVRLIGKDENGNDWDISAKSLLCSLIMAQREQSEREHTAHEVDWNTIWCVCEKDIYSAISEFVVT
ncbi:hypothetical protein [Ruminococcus sp.]|jgi:hypothetical protein|uniref:hypothetical protein n=1 Tax=Ruminococcus sp. TaxID=41978 RepID=UPI0025E40D3A|nr:hypothetical protein [Ruminococcus sp.]